MKKLLIILIIITLTGCSSYIELNDLAIINSIGIQKDDNNGVLEKFPDKYLVAASGLAGLEDSASMTVRQITPRFYLCGDGHSDFHELPLCGARVGLCAAQEALTIARLILRLEGENG